MADRKQTSKMHVNEKNQKHTKIRQKIQRKAQKKEKKAQKKERKNE